MTQKSIPQTGHIDDSLSPDAGPYSSVEWSAVWASILTSQPNQGPIGIPGDTVLQVTNPSGTTINVAAGEAMVGGRNFRSTASVTFSAPAPSANPRIDVVVVVQNESNSSITAGIASGNDFIFPTSLTDYQGSASIPPYSARLAILKGTEAATPSAPTLDQDDDLLYMIPLASYEISTGGVISDLTNLREYTISAGGGNTFVDSYTQYPEGGPMSQSLYNGRVRIVPLRLRFTFPTSGADWNATISFENEDDETLGLDTYATFIVSEIFGHGSRSSAPDKEQGYNFALEYSAVNGYTTAHLFRSGYVDTSGTAQASSTAADSWTVDVLLVQLLDVAPLSLGGG